MSPHFRGFKLIVPLHLMLIMNKIIENKGTWSVRNTFLVRESSTSSFVRYSYIPVTMARSTRHREPALGELLGS